MISFNISGAGPHTIQPTAALPPITDPLAILGATQPGFAGTPLIELDGQLVAADGLDLRNGAAGSLIESLAINRFGLNGILSTADDTVYRGNFIGTDTTGTIDLGNSERGILITAADRNIVGDPDNPNVISGNTFDGVTINDLSSNDNVVFGNFIGTDITGEVDLGNDGYGVVVGSNSSGGMIGGIAPGGGPANVISGNDAGGVYIVGTGLDPDTFPGNQVFGNYIGTDIDGQQAIPNGLGVFVRGPNNVIGGATEGARNIISGNTNQGILISFSTGLATGNEIMGNYIGTDVDGDSAIGNGLAGVEVTFSGNTIGGSVPGAGNLISGNQTGVSFTRADATDNVVAGNLIGTDAAGTSALPNTNHGIAVTGGSNNLIGSDGDGVGDEFERNVISGNVNDGITINSVSSDFTIAGNYIGTDITGTSALGNDDDGIIITGPDNVVGGDTAAERNIIAGNGNRGVYIVNAAATGNFVQGNYIGTDVTGSVDLGNTTHGVMVFNGSDNEIGGLLPGTGNLISGNDLSGVFLDTGASNNVVRGNIVGLDVTGEIAIANGNFGVNITNSDSNTVGGSTAAARNILSGNVGSGLRIVGAPATDNIVAGNYIGTDIDGESAVPNTVQGVLIATEASNNTIGGVLANVISGNTLDGIELRNTGTSDNQIAGNFIGVDATGASPLGNDRFGVLINLGANNNVIGGSIPADRNIISDNNTGVFIRDAGSTGNLVQGNLIGTDANGTSDVGNTQDGVSSLARMEIRLVVTLPRGLGM